MGFEAIGPAIEKFKRFQDNAVNRIASPYSLEKNGLAYWRARVLFSILFTGLTLGTLAMAAAIALVIKENAWELVFLDTVVYTLCLILVFSKRIRYEIRALASLLMCYTFGLMIIISVGPISGGWVWLFAFAVLAGVLLGLKAAILAILVNAVSLTILAWLISNGLFGSDFPFFQ